MKKALTALLLAVMLTGMLPAFQAFADDYWPKDAWRTATPESQGMDSALLADMYQAIAQSGKSINSITIIRNGYLVNEAYFYPYGKEYRHAINSSTKGFVSALAGIALDEGKIGSINDAVLSYFPELGVANADQRKQSLMIRNLLNMTAGFDWTIDNNLSTDQMLQSPDWTRFTLDLPMKSEPGAEFYYCNGAAQIMSSVIQNATGKRLDELAGEKLKPLGIRDMYWITSPENATSGYSGIYMYPDDAAKFGYLYLNNGNWNGTQIVPEKWVEESTKLQATGGWTPLFPGYGYMWWMSRFGGYAALGFGGNYIFVIPELDLVAVFTGGLFSTDDLFYPGELMEKYVVPSVKSDSPLEENPDSAKALSQMLDVVQNPPAPQPAKMPEIVGQINGKTIVIGDSTTFTLAFDKDGSEFTYTINGAFTFTVGLDNVYRIVDAGNLYGLLPEHNHRALRGSWLDEKTLQIFAQDLEDGFEETTTVTFENGQATLNSKSNLYPEQTASGTLTD
jgi:CubicO group peptidase (beta-lactamase class C family)